MPAVRTRLMKERPQAFPAGTVRKCPACSQKRRKGRDDLLREVVVGSMALAQGRRAGDGPAQPDALHVQILDEDTLLIQRRHAHP